MKDKILQWFITGQLGESSKAMAACIAGTPRGVCHPYDPADFNRCLLFLDAVPEAREHLGIVAALSPTWESLVERWDEIEGCFIGEVGHNWCKAKSAPVTYALMQTILDKHRNSL